MANIWLVSKLGNCDLKPESAQTELVSIRIALYLDLLWSKECSKSCTVRIPESCNCPLRKRKRKRKKKKERERGRGERERKCKSCLLYLRLAPSSHLQLNAAAWVSPGETRRTTWQTQVTLKNNHLLYCWVCYTATGDWYNFLRKMYLSVGMYWATSQGFGLA